jgi:transposase
MAASILEKRLAGVRTEDLAKEYGVSIQTIQDHVRGFTATKAMIIKWIDERIQEKMK